MGEIISKIADLVEDCFIERYGEINWHYDVGFEKDIMEKEVRELQFDVSDLIEHRLNEIDERIEEWEKENQEEWDREELKNLKTDMLYEMNNDM